MEEECREESNVIEPPLSPKHAVAVSAAATVATATDSTSGIAKSTNYQPNHHHLNNNLLSKPEPTATTTTTTAAALAATTTTETAAAAASAERSALHDILLNLPSTSRSSMSLLQEEDFGNSQHDFAEVLDEDTTTSGVLETFEISSSNSLPTCSDTAADVAVVDDSSSADAVKILKVTAVAPASARNHNNRANSNINTSSSKFFNESEIYVINDDDDEDDDDDDNDDDDEVDEVDDDDDDEDDEEDDDDDDDVDADDDEDVDDDGVNADVDDEDDDDDDDDVVAIDVSEGELVSKPQTRRSISIPTQLNGVITGTGGQTIYLETPVVEEQQHHHHVSGGNEPGLPKRLSDEFMLHADDMDDHNSAVLIEIDNSNDNVQGSDNEQEDDNNDEEDNEIDGDEDPELETTKESRASLTDKTLRNTNANIAAPVSDAGVGYTAKMVASNDADAVGAGRVKSEPGSNVEGNAERMSFRLKNMSINNSTSQDSVGGNTSNANANATPANDEMPSGSNGLIAAPTMADIESMDLIERRDFETEQRLTGGIILKSSSLTNKNLLNLRLVKQAAAAAQQSQGQQNILPNSQQQSQQESSNSQNTMGRAFSSDSKCTYKEPLTTPTSSRTYNSRLTKSTAKLNMNSTLSQHSLQQPSTSASDSSATSSSVIVEPSSSSASATASTSHSNSLLSSISNSVSSFLSVNNNCQQQPQNQQDEQIQQQDQVESGCSRTSALFSTGGTSNNANGRANDDTEPSTSARCQYTPQTKSAVAAAAAATSSNNIRLMHHASAQTNDRFMSRGTSVSASSPNVVLGVGSSSLGHHLSLAAPGSLRSRRRAEAAANANSGLMAAFKGAAETAASSDSVEIIEDDAWVDCEENTTFDLEEVCTCPHRSDSESSHSSNSTQNEDDFEVTGNSSALFRDGFDLPAYLHTSDDATYADGIAEAMLPAALPFATSTGLQLQQRKRKYDGRMLDHEAGYCGGNILGMGKGSAGGMSCHDGFACSGVGTSAAGGGGDANSRKRIAYDFNSTSTPRSVYSTSTALVHATTPTTALQLAVSPYGSPHGRRTPRSVIPTRENPPPELQNWLAQFQRWTHAERLIAVDRLIEHCEPTQVRHMMKVIEPQFQRDFISLLPRELALQVLAYLDPKDLLFAAQTCRSWRYLCDDNLLWKEKCRKAQILTEPMSDRPKRGRAGKMPPIASPWKAAYMRQHIIETNWRSRSIRDPKVLKGHDEHVITCLQFSGNRIVSGSDDNTLKVWSAVTGRCLRTLIGHTGGVWSSQMSGNIIISGSTDRTLKVWDMETGMCIHTLMGHTSTVRCMHLHGNKVVSGSRDATLRVWDIEQGQCLHVLVGHLAAVRCVQYDGKLIVSGAYDYMVKIWHPERQECLHTLQGHTNRVYSLQFDGVHVVSGSLDTSIRVWDVETGNCKHTLMGHQSLTSGMELRSNILVSGNADSTVKVWDITTGQCLQTLSGPNKHQSAVTCLQFNSRFVVTSSDDGTVKLWDVKTGEFIRNLVSLESGGSGGVVWRIRANDTKLICAVGSRNGTEETKLLVLDFDVEGACVKCS